jgi:hypothetical protein
MTMSNVETDGEKSRSWLSWIVVLVLVGVALALRWHYIREISFFVDEFVTAWAARNVLAHGLPIFPSGNLYPHGLTFTYLEAPFVLGKFDETAARIPGLLVGMACIPVAYWVGHRMFSDRVGLVAAAAMAVDPDFIVWGGRARMYGLLQLFTLLAVYVFYRGLAEDRARDRYLAMGLLVLAIFTHLEAAFLLPALGLAALVALPWRRLFRWNVVLPFAIGTLGAIAFFFIAEKGQPGHLEIMEREGRSYLSFTSDLLSGPQAFAPVFASLHRLPFALLTAGGLYFLFRPRFDRRSPLTYLYVVFTSVVALLILLANETWQRERYLFLVLPLLFLIAGEVLSRLLDVVPALRRPRAWQAALLAAPVALFVGLTGAPTAYVQEWGYDLAFRTLRDQYQPAAGDRVVTSMCTASMLYLGQCDAFAIQQGYEEYVKARPKDGIPADLWTATPMLTTTEEFTALLASTPRVWFMTDGWRFQTRYQPDFILTVLEQMDLVHDERGVMLFRGEGYTPLPQPAVQRERRVDFGGELALAGFDLSSSHPDPGDELEVTLNWQALEGAGPAYTAFLHLIAPDGTGVAGVDEPVLLGLYQPDLWPGDRTLPDRHTLTLPPDLPPGRYRLDLGLYPTGQPEALLPVGQRDRLPLAMLTVGQAASPSSPAVQTGVEFGGQIRLLGYDLACNRQTVACSVQLHWQALTPMARDYTVFVHIVDANGTIVTQDDAPPGDPFFPTTTWLPGAMVEERHLLTGPADAGTGPYTILAGLYDRPTGDRLQAVSAGGNPLGDAVMLATFDAGPESP